MKTIKTIFSEYYMIAIFVLSFFVWGFFIALLQNGGYIFSLFKYDIAFSKKVVLMYKSTIHFYFDNLSLGQQILHLILLLALALQTVLIVYYFKKTKLFKKSFWAGTMSIFATLIGSGCASCGGVVASFLFGTILGPTATSLLPFGGEEFMVLAIIISLSGAYYTFKKIEAPLVC